MTKAGELGTVSRQVLQLLAEGLSTTEMAGRLCLAEQSVKYHLEQLSRYFGVQPTKSHAHHRRLVWLGIHAGLVSL